MRYHWGFFKKYFFYYGGVQVAGYKNKAKVTIAWNGVIMWLPPHLASKMKGPRIPSSSFRWQINDDVKMANYWELNIYQTVYIYFLILTSPPSLWCSHWELAQGRAASWCLSWAATPHLGDSKTSLTTTDCTLSFLLFSLWGRFPSWVYSTRISTHIK